MKRMFRGVLFCPLHRGKSGAAVKGVASAASQSAEWLFCHMTLKVNPVTLTIYSSPIGRYHNPQRRRRCRPLSEANTTFLHNLRRSRAPFLKLAAKPPPPPSARRAVKLKNLKNPRAKGPSTFSTTLFLNPFPQPAADRRPQPSGRSPVNPHAAGVSIACPKAASIEYIL